MTRAVRVGQVVLGGGHPVAIQSMLNAPPDNLQANVLQAKALEQAGCRIVRVAVPDCAAAALIYAVKSATPMPVVADIHFDYRLALEAVAAGADKIRINPGNIGAPDRVKAVADACGRANIPIRIGVNSGSVQKELLAKYGGPVPEALIESAAEHVRLLNQNDFDNIVLSIKSSSLTAMLAACRMASERFDYPLHLGVTEAGGERIGVVKSAIGIGALLAEGIGDTIRVSLTADPVREIAAAKDILKALGMPGCGAQVISCPTCGRTRIDVIGIAGEVERRLEHCKRDIKVAVMGCAVNGPGEAREADVGIAGGDGCGVLFVKGEIVGKMPQEALIGALMKQIEELSDDDD